jgi:putative SOS response-associated peptidase YedK
MRLTPNSNAKRTSGRRCAMAGYPDQEAPGLRAAGPLATVQPMARGIRSPPPKAKPAADEPPSFTVWKAEAVKALQQLHERAAVMMRERDWRNLYVRGLSPDEAASHAARDYAATHRPDWATKGRR